MGNSPSEDALQSPAMPCYVCGKPATSSSNIEPACDNCHRPVCKEHRNKNGVVSAHYACFPCCRPVDDEQGKQFAAVPIRLSESPQRPSTSAARRPPPTAMPTPISHTTAACSSSTKPLQKQTQEIEALPTRLRSASKPSPSRKTAELPGLPSKISRNTSCTADAMETSSKHSRDSTSVTISSPAKPSSSLKTETFNSSKVPQQPFDSKVAQWEAEPVPSVAQRQRAKPKTQQHADPAVAPVTPPRPTSKTVTATPPRPRREPSVPQTAVDAHTVSNCSASVSGASDALPQRYDAVHPTFKA